MEFLKNINEFEAIQTQTLQQLKKIRTNNKFIVESFKEFIQVNFKR